MSKKISELTETIEPKNSDLLPIVSDNETKRVTLSNIINAIKTALNSVYASITHTHTKSEITDFPSIPSKTSDLKNDSNFISTETDPSVPAWAKQTQKPTYTFNEITEKPSTYTPSTHNHDGSYYTKTEIDTLIGDYETAMTNLIEGAGI